MTDASNQSSPNLAVLGEAFRPIAAKINVGMNAAPASRTETESDTWEFLHGHLHSLSEDGGERLGNEVNALGSLLASGGADDAAIYRCAGRFERCLDDLLQGYADLQQANLDEQYARGKELLLETYRHFFGEVQGWLDDLVEACTDPKGAAEKRGLPTSGHVEISLDLKLTAPPALEQFREWVAEQQRQHEAEVKLNLKIEIDEDQPPSQPPKEELGFLGVVLAATLGFGLGEMLFGDDE